MKVPDNSLRIVSTLYWNCWNLVLDDSKVNLSDALDDSKVNLIQDRMDGQLYSASESSLLLLLMIKIDILMS